MSFGVLIVGLGNIGMGYDINHDPDQIISSHARGFDCHPEFHLIGGVDPSSERLETFGMEYSCLTYSSLNDALKEHQPDVVIVATPTELHYQTVIEVLEYCKPKAIVCEKPLSYSYGEAEEMVKHCEQQGVALYVNFMRRSDRGVYTIKQYIQSGKIAQPIKGVCWYSKGIMNNGSHFMNLLQYWLGNVKEIGIMSSGRLWDDKDPEPDVKVDYEKGSVYFLAAREEDYSHYTVELITANGRLRYEQAGACIQWQPVIEDPACEGYQILQSDVEIIKSDMDRIQWHVAEQLHARLNGDDAQICSGIEALSTQKVLENIVKAL